MRSLIVALLLSCGVHTAAARAPQASQHLPCTLQPLRELVLKDNPFATELLRMLILNTAGESAPLEQQQMITDLVRVVEDGYIPTLSEMENILSQLENTDSLKGVGADTLRAAHTAAVIAGLETALHDATIVAIADDVASDVAEDIELFVSVKLAEAIHGHADKLGALAAQLAQTLNTARALPGAAAEQTLRAEQQVAEVVGELLARYTSQAQLAEPHALASTAETSRSAAEQTRPQTIEHYQRLLRGLEGETSPEMAKTMNETLSKLHGLRAEQTQAFEHFKRKMAAENVQRAALSAYVEKKIPSRDVVKPAIAAIKNSILYTHLLAAFADLGTDADKLNRYLAGNAVLSEAELQQVCLHTTCTIEISPMLAVERVLAEYVSLTTLLGEDSLPELAGEEQEIFAAALAVYKRRMQPPTEKKAASSKQLRSPTAPSAAIPLPQDDSKALSPKTKAKAKRARRKYEKRRQEQAAAQQQQTDYREIIAKLIAIDSQVNLNSPPLSRVRIESNLKRLGFNRVEGGGSHPQMSTQKNASLRVVNTKMKDINQTRDLFKQARSIRFREELNDWQGIEGSWQDKRQALLDHLNTRLNELEKNKDKKDKKQVRAQAHLSKLERAIRDMGSYIHLHDSR